MWINSSAFLVLEKILAPDRILESTTLQVLQKIHLFPRFPPRFHLCILAKNTSPSRLWKSCISKTICFLFQGVAQSCMTVKLVKYFLASINKLTFWKFPTVSGHLRHCLVFVTSCPLSPGGALLTVSILHVYWNAINAVVCDITWCFSHNLP